MTLDKWFECCEVAEESAEMGAAAGKLILVRRRVENSFPATMVVELAAESGVGCFTKFASR